MKRLKLLIAGILCAGVLMGCGSNEVSDNDSESATDNASQTESQNTEVSTTSDVELITYPHIDVDFTQLDSPEQYYKFYEIRENPEDYVGKVIKYTGEYTEDGWILYGNVMLDTPRCYMKVISPEDQTGNETPLSLGFDIKFSEKFADGQTLTIVGVFSPHTVPYSEGMYYYLKNAIIMDDNGNTFRSEN